ncbi:MAG TPA: DinB family protein [Abditibacteriaceae bacterium]|jgi:hypothetical protein
MPPLEILAGQMEWASRNYAFNLDFVPDDKLNWKPAPTAGSALEITHHAAGAIRMLQAMMAGTTPTELPVPQTRDEAKEQVQSAAAEYATWVRTVKTEDLERIIDTGFAGKLPLGYLATFPGIDFIHHHGQIAYIQMLLGDTESHFVDLASN